MTAQKTPPLDQLAEILCWLDEVATRKNHAAKGLAEIAWANAGYPERFADFVAKQVANKLSDDIIPAQARLTRVLDACTDILIEVAAYIERKEDLRNFSSVSPGKALHNDTLQMLSLLNAIQAQPEPKGEPA